MTKNFKKFAALGLSVSALACMAVAVGCNKDPETVTYTITVDLPEGATAPSDWKLQYCGTSAGAVCTEVAINAEGVASFTTEALNEVYDLHVLNAGIYKQAEDVSTVVGTSEYTIDMVVKGSGTAVDPYLFEAGVNYTSVYDNTETWDFTYYTYTPAVDTTVTFNIPTSVYAFVQTDTYTMLTATENTLEVSAGVPLTFTVKAWTDETQETTADAVWSATFTAATTPFVADGTAYKPYPVTANQEYTYNDETVYDGSSNLYYKYTATEDGVFKFTSTQYMSSVTVTFGSNYFGEYSYTFDRGYAIEEGESICFNFWNYNTTGWTLNFASDGSITEDKLGSQNNPLTVDVVKTVEDLVVPANGMLYIVLMNKLQFTVPAGLTASLGMGSTPVAAGEVVAFSDHSMMNWRKDVALVNATNEDVAINELAFTEYQAPAGSTAETAFTLSLTEANTATAGDYNNGVYFVFVNEDSQAGTLTFTAANGETVVYSCQAGWAGVSPDAPVEAAGITVNSYDYMIYVYVIFNSTSASSGTVSFTATFTPAA